MSIFTTGAAYGMGMIVTGFVAIVTFLWLIETIR